LHYVGYSKDEILKIAKELAGEMINVDVEEREKGMVISVKLKWTEKLLPNVEASVGIFKWDYTSETNQESETKKTKDSQHREIEQHVKNFAADLADSLIQKFNLEQYYKNKYAQTDTNVLYTVKRTYQTKVGDINYGEDFFLHNARILRELLPAYEPLLSMLLYHVTEHENEEELQEYMFAIADRFDQLFFAHKIISEIISSGETDPNIQFVFGFHLYHFISLIKTLGDNLAWISKFYLNREFQNRQSIDLLDEGFKNAVTSANPRLASLIYNGPELSKFKSLKEYRDIIQHRHKLHVHTRWVGNPPRPKIVIPANPESLVRGNKLRQKKLIQSRGHDIDAILKDLSQSNIEIRSYEAPRDEFDDIDPLDFCKEKVDYILNVYKQVFDRIYLEFLRKQIGEVDNYYNNQHVAVIKIISGELKKGDTIMIEGETTSFIQNVNSMQINHKDVDSAADCDVGVKLDQKARENDKVFEIIDWLFEDKTH
jgi:hypothetical protein